MNDQGQIGDAISAKSFTEIILYGKMFSLTDTWAEVEPPSYRVSGSHPWKADQSSGEDKQ